MGNKSDEEGNISFNPQKFALGFLGGSVGSYGVSKGYKRLEKLAKKYPRAKEVLERLEHKNDIMQGMEKEFRIFKTLKKYKVDKLTELNDGQFYDFVKSVWDLREYANAPSIVKIATLNNDLAHNLGLTNRDVFLTKKDLSHFRQVRKQNFNQALSEQELLNVPKIIRNAKNAYIDTKHKNFFIVFEDTNNTERLNFIHFNVDELGNFIITTKKANKEVLRNKNYKPVRQGIEPNIS